MIKSLTSGSRRSSKAATSLNQKHCNSPEAYTRLTSATFCLNTRARGADAFSTYVYQCPTCGEEYRDRVFQRLDHHIRLGYGDLPQPEIELIELEYGYLPNRSRRAQ